MHGLLIKNKDHHKVLIHIVNNRNYNYYFIYVKKCKNEYSKIAAFPFPTEAISYQIALKW